MADATPLMVLEADERTFSLSREPSGELVYDADRERVGPVVGDFAGFYLGDDSMAFAAAAQNPRVVLVHIAFPRNEQVCPVHNGVWMSFPEPFTPGERVTAIFKDAARREVYRYTTPPLRIEELEPHPDAGWTSYAPS